MTKTTVIDSIMGSGKSSYAIQKMNENNDNKYIYITPYLDEVARIKNSCTSKKFYEPINKGKGKLESLHKLLLKGNNIASTHALFRTSTNVTQQLIKSNDYILILDEVMNVIEQVHLKKNDLEILLDEDLISIGEKGIVVWNENKLDFESQYDYIKQMCLNKNLFLVNNALFLWTFPVDIFESFKEVYIMTYLFDGQIQKYYYDLFDIEYEYKSVRKENGKYTICDYIDLKNQDISKFKNLINILDNEKMNSIGKGYALSKTWFTKEENKPLIKQLKNNVHNYYINILKSKSKENLWTTFKDYKKSLSGKGYTKAFISCNIRATNDYIDKFNLAYCCNIYFNPYVKKFFIDRGIKVNEDMFALSEELQWIWRSRIRIDKDINLYIPSERMRNLLKKWLLQN